MRDQSEKISGKQIQEEIRNAINTVIDMYTTQKLEEQPDNPYSLGSCVVIGMANALFDFVAMQEKVAYLYQRGLPITDLNEMPYPITRSMREHVLLECQKILSLYRKD